MKKGRDRIVVNVIALGLAVALLFAYASIVQAVTVSWTNPTTYTDNTPISAANQATIATKLYKSLDHITWGAPFGTTSNGANSWVGTIPGATPGVTIYVTGTASIPSEGIESAYAPYYTWTVPYVAPKAPTSVVIGQ